eukprot:4520815-Amphidinium_carterae.2
MSARITACVGLRHVHACKHTAGFLSTEHMQDVSVTSPCELCLSCLCRWRRTMGRRFRHSVKVRHLEKRPWQVAAKYLRVATSSLQGASRLSIALDAARTGGRTRMLGFITRDSDGFWCPPLVRHGETKLGTLCDSDRISKCLPSAYENF